MSQSGFFKKYQILKSEYKGRGSSATVYGVENLETYPIPSESNIRKVVKVCTASDEASFEAAENEVRIF